MKPNNTLQIVGRIALSTTLASSLFVTPIYASETSQDIEKTETVYSVLNDDGSVDKTTVSSWLHGDQGIHNVQETLSLKHVENVKTDEEPIKHGKTYTWNVQENDVYYTGDTTKKLPVDIQITYELNGQTMSAKEMKGKSGHATIRVAFTSNKTAIVQSGGKSINVHPAILAGGMIDFDSNHYKNISCSQGKVMSDGSNQILTFASVPGLEDTLTSAGLQSLIPQFNVSDTCVIEADVTDFDLGSIMIGMTSDFDLNDLVQGADMSSLSSNIARMVDASDQLQDGSKKLFDGTTALKTKAQPLVDASGSVNELSGALVTLDSGAQRLNGGTHVLADGVKDLYAIPSGTHQIKAAVDTSTSSQISLKDGAIQLQNGLNQLNKTVDQIDENQLDTLSKQIEGSKQALTNMNTTLTTSKTTLTTMSESLTTASETLAGLKESQKQLSALCTTLVTELSEDQQIIANNNTQIQTKVDDINKKIASANSEIDAQVTSLQSAAASLRASKKGGEENADADAVLEQQAQALDAQATSLSGSKISALSADDLKLTEITNIESFSKNVQALSTSLSSLSTTFEGMSTTIENAQTGLDSLSKDLESSYNTLDSMQQMITQVKIGDLDYKTMIVSLQKASSQLSDGSDELVAGIQQLDTALGTLETESSSGIQELEAGSKSLTEGSAQLVNGTSQLASQKDKLDSMGSGLEQLGSAFTELNDGAKKLYNGQTQFNEEAMKPLQQFADLASGEVAILTDTFNAMKQMTEENSNFAGAPDGAKCKVNYVLRTKE